MYKKSIVWFRQDLRVYDNTALFEAIKTSENIIPIFILDKNLIPNFGGISDQKFGFLREALENLSNEIKEKGGVGLNVFHGFPEEILPNLCEKYKIEKVFINRSYDSYGKKRDSKISEILFEKKIEFEDFADFLLVEPEEIHQMKVFTPFYKRWKNLGFSSNELEIKNIFQFEIEENKEAKDFIKMEKHLFFTIDFGKKRFENNILKNFSDIRNDLDKDGTSRLSIYLRFGIFSVRQIYNKAKNINEKFLSELAWREFWHHITYNFPFTLKKEFLEKRRNIEWSNDEEKFQKWCDGETGYPVVDACMKQLNTTNWMHGRGRMIVASFLTKDLHIDWRLGEKYFREKLLDYDESVNIGNWQWSASVGADPKPLRIFNPILQSEKFDSKAIFIKKYIPSLEKFEAEKIHNPLKNILFSYLEPIVDHSIEQKVTKEIYKKSSEIFENKKELL